MGIDKWQEDAISQGRIQTLIESIGFEATKKVNRKQKIRGHSRSLIRRDTPYNVLLYIILVLYI